MMTFESVTPVFSGISSLPPVRSTMGRPDKNLVRCSMELRQDDFPFSIEFRWHTSRTRVPALKAEARGAGSSYRLPQEESKEDIFGSFILSRAMARTDAAPEFRLQAISSRAMADMAPVRASTTNG
jgi:hypothetical protein